MQMDLPRIGCIENLSSSIAENRRPPSPESEMTFSRDRTRQAAVAHGGLPLHDPQAPVDRLREGRLSVPWSKFFNKNVSVKMGRDDDERWDRKLRDMVLTGAAKPSRIVSHRLSLDEAPDAFAKFDKRQEALSRSFSTPGSFVGRCRM